MRLITTRITGLSPVSIRLLGVSVPVDQVVAADPDSLVAGLAVGDLVGVLAQPGDGRTTVLTLIGRVADL